MQGQPETQGAARSWEQRWRTEGSSQHGQVGEADARGGQGHQRGDSYLHMQGCPVGLGDGRPGTLQVAMLSILPATLVMDGSVH